MQEKRYHFPTPPLSVLRRQPLIALPSVLQSWLHSHSHSLCYTHCPHRPFPLERRQCPCYYHRSVTTWPPPASHLALLLHCCHNCSLPPLNTPSHHPPLSLSLFRCCCPTNRSYTVVSPSSPASTLANHPPPSSPTPSLRLPQVLDLS